MNAAINQDVMVKTAPANPLDLHGLEQVFYHLTYLKVINELHAPKGHTNDFAGGYKYRSAEDIQEALKPILLKHKCTVITRKFDTEGGFEIYAYMVFKDQTYIRCDVPGVAECDFERDLSKNKNNTKTQQYAAYQSYAKKYALGNLLQIDDSKDDLDARSNEIIQKERQNNHAVTQADCDRALKQINDLPLDTPLDQAVKTFDQIVRTYPAFYDVLNNACCKKHAEIEQHLFAIQNAQQDTVAFNNTGNTSQSKNTNNLKTQSKHHQNNAQTAQTTSTNNTDAFITSKQFGELEVFIDERGLDMQEVCKHLAIDSLKQIKVAELSVIKGEIERMAHEVLKQ